MRATLIKPNSPGHHAQGLSAGQGSLLIRLGSDYGAGGARRGAGVQATTWTGIKHLQLTHNDV